ncbi:MAG: lipocalin-like domain protein [Glaciihabitans sp.]|nr:lipocalin-like domain protein [Glaciihabitans sp.]
MLNKGEPRVDPGITHDAIVGSWRLLSAVQHFDDGTKAAEFGPNASGYLCYTAEGTVSAVLGASDRPQIAALDPQDATPAEYASSARAFVAYAGTYVVNDETSEVIHNIEISLYPNWQAHSQLRVVKMDGDTVTIVASPRVTATGRAFHSELRWRRVSR